MAGLVHQHVAYSGHWLVPLSSLLGRPQSSLEDRGSNRPISTQVTTGSRGSRGSGLAPAGTRRLRQLHGHALPPDYAIGGGTRSGPAARDTQLLIPPPHWPWESQLTSLTATGKSQCLSFLPQSPSWWCLASERQSASSARAALLQPGTRNISASLLQSSPELLDHTRVAGRAQPPAPGLVSPRAFIPILGPPGSTHARSPSHQHPDISKFPSWPGKGHT